LPASTNRSRQLPTVAEDTPCRRAASASDNSPFNTANTTWICSSADTCRDGFCCLLTQPSFPTPQLNPLPESLTRSTSMHSNICSILKAWLGDVRCRLRCAIGSSSRRRPNGSALVEERQHLGDLSRP